MKKVTWKGPEEGDPTSYIVVGGEKFRLNEEKVVAEHLADKVKKVEGHKFSVLATGNRGNTDKKQEETTDIQDSGGPGGQTVAEPDPSGAGEPSASKGRTP